MPVKAYYKGSGLKVKRDMVKRYGPDLGARIFYAKAAKMRLRPQDKSNLARPKKGWKKGQRALVLAAMQRAKSMPKKVPKGARKRKRGRR